MIGIVLRGRFLDTVRIETDPRLPPVDRTWRLLERLRYIDSKGQEHWVPMDFATDGASIPRFFWRAAGHPLQTEYVAAAVVHDFLWQQALAGDLPFFYANHVFLDALRTLGVGQVRRTAMWGAVSLNAARILAWRRIRRAWGWA